MAGKRSNGEGCVFQLPSGQWHRQVMDGFLNTGKKRMRYFTGRTKKDVLKQIWEFQNQRSLNIHINQEITLGEWADQWYESYQTQVQPSTYSNYQYTLKILKECLGHMKMVEILPLHVGNTINQLVEKSYSKSVVTKCRAMLIQIFDAAEDNGIIARNPARKVKPIKGFQFARAPEGKAKDAFTEEECALLLSHLPNNLIGHSIRLMLLTGMRSQELLALACEDISADGSSISIAKAIKMVDGKPMLGPPKSKMSERIIPVPGVGRESARYLKAHGKAPLIWSVSLKQPLYSVSSFRRIYYNVLQKIDGVRRLPPHSCRHTYVTRLQANGVPLETIARLAGHSEIMTTDGYLHISTDSLASSVEVLSEAPSAKKPGELSNPSEEQNPDQAQEG